MLTSYLQDKEYKPTVMIQNNSGHQQNHSMWIYSQASLFINSTTDRCRRPGDLAPPVVAGSGPIALLRGPVLDVGQGDEVQVLRKRLALEERGAQRSDWYRAVLDAFVLNIKATYEIYRFW